MPVSEETRLFRLHEQPSKHRHVAAGLNTCVSKGILRASSFAFFKTCILQDLYSSRPGHNVHRTRLSPILPALFIFTWLLTLRFAIGSPFEHRFPPYIALPTVITLLVLVCSRENLPVNPQFPKTTGSGFLIVTEKATFRKTAARMKTTTGDKCHFPEREIEMSLIF